VTVEENSPHSFVCQVVSMWGEGMAKAGRFYSQWKS